MRFENLQRLKEVQQKLGPLLDKLGVKAKLKRVAGEIAIKFENKQGTMKVPVALYLYQNATTSGEEGSWSGTELEIQHWDENHFAPGWAANSFSGTTTSIYLGTDNDENFQAINQAIAENDVVYLGRSHPGRTEDEYFANAYDYVRGALLSEDDEEVTCLREDAFDSMNFTDPAGQKWKIAFKELEAIVAINGAEVTRFPADEPRVIANFIRKRIGKQKVLDEAFSPGW